MASTIDASKVRVCCPPSSPPSSPPEPFPPAPFAIVGLAITEQSQLLAARPASKDSGLGVSSKREGGRGGRGGLAARLALPSAEMGTATASLTNGSRPRRGRPQTPYLLHVKKRGCLEAGVRQLVPSVPIDTGGIGKTWRVLSCINSESEEIGQTFAEEHEDIFKKRTLTCFLA